ncbi:hypothetical protein J1N35_011025 [Gossypium stocksii]|uniref:Uncharacterized protein n=1 Tax=Gossypium stocksii TaxID=47602 RepID=A0A9D3W240_9ROSI|nr:hypothetical protein J1N35_011025 [Gossypium stocksii]
MQPIWTRSFGRFKRPNRFRYLHRGDCRTETLGNKIKKLRANKELSTGRGEATVEVVNRLVVTQDEEQDYFFRNKRVDPLQTLWLAKDLACYWCSVFCTNHTVFMHPDANSGSPNGSAATIHNCYDYVGYVAWKKGDAGYGASFLITDGAGRCLKHFVKQLLLQMESRPSCYHQRTSTDCKTS